MKGCIPFTTVMLSATLAMCGAGSGVSNGSVAKPTPPLNGMSFNASASREKGYSDGEETTHTLSHVMAGGEVALQSGGDTTLRGASVEGERVRAEVGGNLRIGNVLVPWNSPAAHWPIN